MTSNNTKLKILALHGYRQSDKIFSAKIGSLRKCFKNEIDFIFLKAPHKVPQTNESKSNKDSPQSIEENDEYGWWFNTEDKAFKAIEPSNLSIGFDESILLIEKTIKDEGPFDGLLGFSQGGAFASILCSMQEKNFLSIGISFAIIISGFKSLCKPHEVYFKEKIVLPTLHIYGHGDKIIPLNVASQLSNIFINKKIVEHEGGHYVPGKKYIYEDFIREMSKNKIH